MLNQKISFFAIISKTSTEAGIKCDTNEFRMEKRTFWCIACICPAKNKRFEYVSFVLLKAKIHCVCHLGRKLGKYLYRAERHIL